VEKKKEKKKEKKNIKEIKYKNTWEYCALRAWTRHDKYKNVCTQQ
jgi:hypothetical protein